MQTKIVKATVLALSLGMIGGCAEMAAQIEQAKASAAEALARANDAYDLAQNASNTANEAAFAASEAQAAADAAQQCCNENSDKMDRMFEKAMMK